MRYNKTIFIDHRDLKIDPKFRHRSAANSQSASHVADLIRTLHNKGALDPILVWSEADKAGVETGNLVLLDGYFRVQAYKAIKDKRGIPSLIFRGSLKDAELEALTANTRTTQALTLPERSNAAWGLVQRYGNEMSKREISSASNVSQRTIARMRQQLKAMRKGEGTPTENWMQDQKWPLENTFTPPTDEEQKRMIAEIAAEVQEVFRKYGRTDVSLKAEALLAALGERDMKDMADYLFAEDEDEFAPIRQASLGDDTADPETAF